MTLQSFKQDDQLLSLSNEIARIRAKTDLLSLINTRLNYIVPFSSCMVLRVDNTTMMAHPYIFDGREKWADNYSFYCDIGYAIMDESIEGGHKPVLSYTDSLQPVADGDLNISENPPVSKCVTIKLIDGSLLIGFWIVFFKPDERCDKEMLEVLRKISYPIAIATANIIAAEDRVMNEDEKNKLLLLSNEIATIKKREDLSRFVNGFIQKTLSVTEFGIAYVHEDGKSYGAFYMEMSNDTRRVDEFEKVTSAKYTVTDTVFRMITQSKEPTLLDVDELLTKPGIPTYVFFWKRAGIRKVLSVPLWDGQVAVGFINFHVDGRQTILKMIHLLKSVSTQLVMAISNILANEKIKKRDEEKNVLLSLSNEIAALKTRENLSLIVNTRIKKLLSVNEFGIAQVDEDGQTYSAFVLDFSDRTKSTPGFHVVTSARYSTDDPIFTKVRDARGPIWFDVAEVAAQTGMPEYVRFWKEAGHQYYLHVPLRVGGVLVGFVPLHFESRDDSKANSMLLNGICAQIGVAVSNILANEKILASEQEKNLLLSLSNEIASVKDREDLFRVISGSIKELFSVRGLGFSKINEDGDTYSIFFMDQDKPTDQQFDMERMLKARYDAHEPLYREIIASEDPIVYNMADLLSRPNPPAYIKFLAATGAERLLTAALRIGGHAIGTAHFVVENGVQFEVKSSLLKGVCSQLAVAISNILTIENNYERQIEKSKLLDFSNAIAAIHDKMQFLKLLNTKLRELFRFSHAMIACINDDKKSCITFILDPQEKDPEEWEYNQVIIENVPLKNSAFEMVSSGFVLVDLNEFVNTGLAPDFIRRNYDGGSLEMLIAPLKEDNRIIGFFMLFSREREWLDNNQLNILSGVTHQLSIAAANIVANEKIQKQLTEINNYKQRLEQENYYLQQEIKINHNHSEIIGSSPAIKSVLTLVEQVAPSESTVLILGETGTGKELIARAIHNSSPRKKELMIKINCAALPASLIESELFGHERGSFTGAIDRRIGKFELADKSTLFLDEIGELSPELQVKLLRALQEKEIERIGGKTTIKIDVRIIAATNRDLEQMITDGRFRLDLYYRLHIFPIMLPPLRDRKEDIPVLSSHFVSRYAKKAGKIIHALNAKALKELIGYDWPGNIRELEHVIERSVLLTNTETIHTVYLPAVKTVFDNNKNEQPSVIQTLQEQEKDYILKILKKVNGRISGPGGAAELLGLPASTLNSKLKKLGIHREHRG